MGMKRTFLSVTAALLAPALFADASSAAIVALLNTGAAQSPKAYAAAAARVRLDAEAGRPLQRFVLAVLSDNPDTPPFARLDAATRRAYLADARERIHALAEKRNNPLAWYLLSLEKNDLAALRRAVDGGNVQALNAWGTLRLQEALANPGPSTNTLAAYRDAFDSFRRAAGKRDANGLYNLGMCHLQGYGCRTDPLTAFQCFRSAAEAGHTEAINNIGGCYRDGIVVTADPVQAARWFAKSAELGNPYGELNYALALQRGDGVKKDETLAAEFLKSSAERGCPEAMNVYAMCFHRGVGVPRDLPRAITWFRRAAAAGFPPAMDNLAACCENGLGVKKDAGKALVWKMRARAVRGDKAARDWLNDNKHPLHEDP
jgi:TPR repeat protein